MRKAFLFLLILGVASSLLAGDEVTPAPKEASREELQERIRLLEAKNFAPRKSMGWAWGFWAANLLFPVIGGAHRCYLGEYVMGGLEWITLFAGANWLMEFLFYGIGLGYGYDDCGVYTNDFEFYCFLTWFLLWVYDAFTITEKVKAYNERQLQLFLEKNAGAGRTCIPIYAEYF